MRKFLYYFIPIILCFAVGLLGSYIQGSALEEWYPYLVKSPLTPPAIVFPIAWSILYILIGLSLGVMISRGDMGLVKLWILQLLLNFLWSVLFFGMRSPLLGFITILLLDIVVFAYIISTLGRRNLAMWLFLPYLLWLLFATYLNGYIYLNNNHKNQSNMTQVKERRSLLTLPVLPYASDELEPKMSRETIEYHYGKHFKTYIDNTNRLIEGTPFEGMGLEYIVLKSDGTLFNNAAQALNHKIYFEGLTPVQKPISQELKRRIERDFGSMEIFYKEFTDAATKLFGSGWVWLVEDKRGKLSIIATKDADNPIRHNLNPLMCIDVWEHAYYIDYRNRRADFIKNYMELVDWDRAQAKSAF